MEVFDVATEQPISLTEAATYLAADPNGKKLNIRTIERWIKHGCRGVFLEGAYIGDRLQTSKESLARFSLKCSGVSPKAKTRSVATARKSHEKAKAYLESQGVGKSKKTRATA